MGRKVDMKKIENVTKCQVTFSKRRSSLIKKANELSVLCDVDVAFVTFSPSGRLSKFSSQTRIEDVLDRYINLPADKRYAWIRKVEEKQEKLRKLDYIMGDGNKLHHLNKQIENFERQIKIKSLDLHILEAGLRDFEPDLEQPSLAQLQWCERNLKNSLCHVINKKMELEKQGSAPFLYNFNGKEPNMATQKPTTSQLLIQLDPWISPYSSRVRGNILQDLNRGKGISIDNGVLGMSNDFTSNLPITGLPSLHQSGTSSLAPETLIPPTYNPNQQAAGNCIVPLLPNQQLRGLDSSSMGMLGHDTPFGVQQNPRQTFGHQEVVSQLQNNLNRQDRGIPMFQFNTNPEKVNWFTSGNHNQNLNVYAPINYERIISPVVYEPLFTPCNAAAPTTTTNGNGNGNGNNNNRNGRYDANEERLAAPGQVDLPLEHPEDLPLPNQLSIEDLMENDALWTAGNKEGDSWEWDGSVLPENLNLEDLDIQI